MSSRAGYVPDLTGPRTPAAKPRQWGGLVDFSAGIEPGFDQGLAGPNAGSNQVRYEAQVWEEITRGLNARGRRRETQVDFLGVPLARHSRPFRTPDSGRGGGTSLDMVNAAADADAEQQAILAALAAEQARDPAFFKGINGPDGIAAEVARRRRDAVARAQAATPDSVAGMAGAFVGQMGAAFTDPITLITLPLGAGRATAQTVLGRILQTAGTEALVQGAVTAATTPLIALDAAGAGFDYGIEEALTDVAVGAAAGGAFGAVFEGGSEAMARAFARVRKDAEIVKAAEDEIAAASPFERTPQGDAEHLARLDAVAQAIANDEPVPDFGAPVTPLRPEGPATPLGTAAAGIDDGAGEIARLEAEALAELRGLVPEAPAAPAAPPVAPAAPVVPAAAAFDPVGYLDAARAYVAGKGSLKPEAMGKALGVSPVEAGRVLGALASTKNSGLFMSKRSNVIRRLPKLTGPEDVIGFLARRGGLRDDEGHSLRNVGGLDGILVGGAGPVIRKDGGMGLDEAGELLKEAGYFGRREAIGDASAPETVTVADVIDLLERASRQWNDKTRRVYLDEDKADVLAGAREQAGAAELTDRMDFARQDFAAAGITDLTDAELEAAAKLRMEIGEDADLVEAFVMSEAWDARAAVSAANRADDDFDLAWLDNSDDAMEAPDGRDDAEPDEFGDGAGEGGGRPDPAGSAADAGGDTGGAGARADGGEGEQNTGISPATPEEAAARVAASLDDLKGFDGADAPGAVSQTGQLMHDLLPKAEGPAAKADAAPALLDTPEAVDPAIAARNRQSAQLGADSPLRPGDRAEQDDVDGLPMFDAARSPDMFGGAGAPDSPEAAAFAAAYEAERDAGRTAYFRGVKRWDKPEGASSAWEAGWEIGARIGLHEPKRAAVLRAAALADANAGLADTVAKLDADTAAIEAVKGCLL